jgi:hypothetical protein
MSNTFDRKSASFVTGRRKISPRSGDTALEWVIHDYPQLAAWRELAVNWLKGEIRAIDTKLFALVAFFERYLIQQGLPVEPATFMRREHQLPDFYKTACPDSYKGIMYNNSIHEFLQFVLLHEFGQVASDGQIAHGPEFRNPVPRLSIGGAGKISESVYSPLPYGYIDDLRQMLASGPNFRDWVWAQGLQRSGGKRAYAGWFEVPETHIDLADPDCVWRTVNGRDGTGFEIWSPVRWVLLLVKLILPLRTTQVRLLDSGEADTWEFEAGAWKVNAGPLAQGSEKRPLQQGVFRRQVLAGDPNSAATVFYINSNKTADIGKSGGDNGYLLPWPMGGPVHQDASYWLEKLRNWQRKYNPIKRRTSWKELDSRHIQAKSEVQLASYPDACFLFRAPEAGPDECDLPYRDKGLDHAWFPLLDALERQLLARGETHQNGTPIRFTPAVENQSGSAATLYPLHSLRVSLITALALDGNVPFPILQKLVGHSRLMMTLYYTKPGTTHINEALSKAAAAMEKVKAARIQDFLIDTEHEQIVQRAICNSVPSLAAAIPIHPAARNLAGWMPMHHGLCLVGGNTSEIEESRAGGCYNGGPLVGGKYTQVPGGSRNCVRCRWFVTEPHFLPALAAHFNTVAYHFDEARNACLMHEETLNKLKKERLDAENASTPFTGLEAYRQAERVWETTMKRFSDLAEDMVACWRLIERCQDALNSTDCSGGALIAVGSIGEVHAQFEQTSSELLQLSGVCADAEVYADLEPGKAIFRRSQLLDQILYREHIPPMFMLLTEDEQLHAGNAFMRRLAKHVNPANPILGRRQVISLIDAGISLSQRFGVDLSTLVRSIEPVKVGKISDRPGA